ncbi:MAG: DUF3090 family protein [Actinomycetales bacterium]|nr:DUF3090 family protein [Actinomycetales bacterium]
MRHSFTNPNRCVAGTIGAPGERAFFIQVRSDNRIISVALEKAQVQAVANRLEMMIAEVRKVNPLILVESLTPDDAPLETPVDEEFQVGAISLAWNDQTQLIVLELFELEDAEEDADADVLEINFSIGMALAFAQRSKALVNAGRLPCPFCGIPIDPRGHLCPRANGYRR